nr:hypothetical protein [Desulfobacteraceae bacterium]
MTDIPRKTALGVLDQLMLKHHPHLDRIITDSVDNAGGDLPMRDRRLVNALIFGVLRWRGNLDWIISRYSKTPLEKIRPEIAFLELKNDVIEVPLSNFIPNSQKELFSKIMADIAKTEIVVWDLEKDRLQARIAPPGNFGLAPHTHLRWNP